MNWHNEDHINITIPGLKKKGLPKYEPSYLGVSRYFLMTEHNKIGEVPYSSVFPFVSTSFYLRIQFASLVLLAYFSKTPN